MRNEVIFKFFFSEPGQSGHLRDDRSGRAFFHMKIFEFRQTDWSCSQQMEAELAELSTWRFLSKSSPDGVQAKMDLGINAVLSHGTHVLSIYAPFWMINKTGKMLTYKGQDPQNVIYHSPDLKQDEVSFKNALQLRSLFQHSLILCSFILRTEFLCYFSCAP